MAAHSYFSLGFVLEEVQGFIVRHPREKKVFTNISQAEIEYFFKILLSHCWLVLLKREAIFLSFSTKQREIVSKLCIGNTFQKRVRKKQRKGEGSVQGEGKSKGPVWPLSSNNNFHILNNITYISTHFFTYTYFKKLQTTILKLFYQTPQSV